VIHCHENIKLSNKKEILKMINKTTNTSHAFKHNLVESGISTYDYDLKKVDVFKSIINTFIKLAKGGFEAIDFWFNKYKNNGYVKPHNHVAVDGTPNKDCLVGVYYFKKKDKSGDLVVNKKKIKIKEDDFLIFDTADVHYSLPNKTNQERIVFSINMRKMR
tara:strand:- start:387 stop:869 length:483 start_codon:yes stop_codon:yes gene_type:complete